MKKRLIYICLNSILIFSFLHSNSQESYYNKAKRFYIDKQYDKAQTEFENVIKYSTDTLEIAKSYNNLGIIYKNKGLYSKAIEYYEFADSIFSLSSKNHVYKSNIYMNIGIIEKNKGNYYSAIQKYLHAEAISLYNNEVLNLARVYTNLGNVYKNLNDYNKAISYHKRSLRITKDNNLMDLDYPLINLAEVYVLKGVYDTAQIHYKKVLAYSKNISRTVQNRRRIEYAVLLYKSGKYKQAETFVSNVEKEISFDNKNISHLELYLELGDYYTATKNHKKGVGYYNLCIDFLSGFADKENLSNFPNKFMIQAISGKANLLYVEYLDTKNKEYLLNSYQSFKKALQYIQNFEGLTLLPESRIMFSHAEQESFDGIIACLYALWESTEDKKYLHEALFLSSNYKAAELSNYQNKIKQEGKNETVFSENHALIEKLNYTIYKANTGSNPLEENIALYNQADSLYKLLKPYPDTSKKVSVNDFIRKLTEGIPNDLSIVDYVLTENAVFSFVINKGNILFTKQNRPGGLEQIIRDYYKQVSQALWDRDYNASLSEYYNKGLKLYSILIEPVEKNLKARLKIIPDEDLYLISFDGLPYEKGITPEKVRHIKPLLEKYAISYDYSLQAYLNSRAALVEYKMTAFFPSYEKNYMNLYDKDEIKEIAKVFRKFKSYEKKEVSKQVFLKSNRKGIYLLSMHGVVDENNPNFSYLIFTDDSITNKNSVLYNYEIPNKDYSNNLIILRACETGKGRLYNASGMQSLSKTFRSLRATVIGSNWSLDKYSSNKILLDFYGYTKDGMTKDIALARAKRKFRSECHSVQDYPFFWSALTLYGSENSLKRNSNRWLILIGVILGGVLIIYFSYRKFL